MKNKLTTLLSIFISINAIAQVHPDDSKNTIFYEMWNIYYSHKDYTYFAPTPLSFVNDGPGKVANLFEAQLALPFPLFVGRDHQRISTRGSGLFIIPKNMSRMYLIDDEGKPESSFPVRPLNFNPILSYVHFLQKAKDRNRCDKDYIYHRGIDLHNVKYKYYTLDLAHFSNGQSDSAINKESLDKTDFTGHNNHYTGNFSTNYLKLSFYTVNYNKKMKFWVTKSFFYQYDMNLFGLFGFDETQFNRYGKHRIGGMFQWQSEAIPKRFKTITIRRLKCKLNGDYEDLNKEAMDSKWYYTMQFRLEPTYIVDGLNEYLRRDKDKLSIKLSAALFPLNWRSLGILTQFYYGRDYYNIRYDQRLLQFKIGFVMDPNKFIPKNVDYYQKY